MSSAVTSGTTRAERPDDILRVADQKDVRTLIHPIQGDPVDHVLAHMFLIAELNTVG